MNWIFGLIDRVDKQARIYFVMKVMTRDILLDIEKNVYTCSDDENDENK